MPRPRPWAAITALCLAALTLSACAPGDQAVHCSEHVVPVRMNAAGPADQRISGTLCHLGDDPPSVVQVLVPGATYDRTYFDPPVGGADKSYVHAATDPGYATFAVDRLGTGYSSHPDPALLDATAGAVALHDVITALRAGRVGGARFDTVVWVGHSLGAAIGWLEIARYHDVDALVVTSEMHRINPAGWNQLATLTAVADTRWGGAGLGEGYLTTAPAARGLFYHHRTAAAPTIAWDTANRDVSTLAELTEARALVDSPDPATAPSRRITVPVLVAVGAQDPFWCGGAGLDCGNSAAVARHEQRYYPASRDLQVITLPDVGHSVNLHENAAVTTATILDWISSLGQER